MQIGGQHSQQGNENSLEQLAEQQNNYVRQLAEVNKTSDVVSTEDIYNQNGLLIVPKSTNISHDIADRILQHKLIKPLEEQVKLQNALNADALKKDTGALLEKYPDLLQIHSNLKFEPVLETILERNNLHDILTQKLTVMRERLPQEYEKSVFCAWLSALIATEAKMEPGTVAAAYLSGLLHDIGLLHIPENILRKQEALTPDEWRTIQCHVVVAAMLMKRFEGKDSIVAQAVADHHERCDASGYPVGKTDEHLDFPSQIIGLADSLQAIRINRFSKCGRNLRDALPYLHMNSQIHFTAVYKAMCSILLKSGLQASGANPLGDEQSLVSHLLEQRKKLMHADEIIDELLAFAIENGEICKKITKAVKPLDQMIHSSGLLRKEIMDWLLTLHGNSGGRVLEELLEMELMQNELLWQLKHVHKTVSGHIDAQKRVLRTMTRKKFNEILDKLGSLIQ